MAKQTIQEFIAALKASERHFTYETKIVNRHFMFSYDMTQAIVDEFYSGEFRPYIIAALHVKGARNIKSHVSSTIYFEADAKEGDSWTAMQNWKKYLNKLFGPHIKLMIGVLRETSSGGAIFDKIADASIEAEFERIKKETIEKFSPPASPKVPPRPPARS